MRQGFARERRESEEHRVEKRQRGEDLIGSDRPPRVERIEVAEEELVERNLVTRCSNGRGLRAVRLALANGPSLQQAQKNRRCQRSGRFAPGQPPMSLSERRLSRYWRTATACPSPSLSLVHRLSVLERVEILPPGPTGVRRDF